MEKTFREQIKEEVDNICEKHNLKQPITVPGSATLIKEHNGLERAIELFEGAHNQESDFFKRSAYKATLETTLKRE
jgi:hypothetical protein